MTYDFTTLPDRRSTGSLKWDRFQDRDVLPFWVADMDFVSAPEILAALRARVDHGVFGYTTPFTEAETAALDYLRDHHGVRAERDWLVWLPGLVQGLNLVCRAWPGAVMIHTPVYPPFRSAPLHAGTTRLEVPLKATTDSWEIDFDAMETAVTPSTRVFILCNPHNPVGRVFRRSELERLAEFCLRHNLVLCSDEIHCDLILDDVPHVPALNLSADIARRTVAFYSASKTYNLPGLACAYAVIPDPNLRAEFRHALRGLVTEVNCFGYTGLIAAYRHGEPWRQELLRVLRANRDRLNDFTAAHLPGLVIRPMESTYLAWMDARPLGLDNPIAHFAEHGVGLSEGADFGAPGWVRFNFGCPPSRLEEGLARMRTAIQRAR
jgi:cysteine-S-conjugate beta-lyase